MIAHIRLHDVVLCDEVWLLPKELASGPRFAESDEQWVERVVQAAQDGRVVIIKNVAQSASRP